MAMSCSTVMSPFSGYVAGLATLPVMNTFRLRISLTTTVAFGSSMNFEAASISVVRSSSGVKPAACTSFSSGSEILPSGRTTTSTDMSLSRQNTIDKTSDAPTT